MNRGHNPFHFGDGLCPDDLVGRKDEVALVENTIRNGSRLFMSGPRRFGKTSILCAAEESLSKSGAMVLRVNAEVSPSTRMLIEQIIAAAATRLKEHYEDGYERAWKYFSQFSPEFSVSAEDGEISVRIGLDRYADENSQLEALTNTLDCLDRMAAAQPDSRPVGLIIDEFSALASRGGVKAEAMIRSVTQRHQNLAYVFIGSLTRLMSEMISKHDRPFYHGGDVCYVRPVPAAMFAPWLKQKLRGSGFEIDSDEPVQNILVLADEVPYNVQMLAHNCWEELRYQSGVKLTAALVHEVFQRTVNELAPMFAHTWSLSRCKPGSTTLISSFFAATARQTPMAAFQILGLGTALRLVP